MNCVTRVGRWSVFDRGCELRADTPKVSIRSPRLTCGASSHTNAALSHECGEVYQRRIIAHIPLSCRSHVSLRDLRTGDEAQLADLAHRPWLFHARRNLLLMLCMRRVGWRPDSTFSTVFRCLPTHSEQITNRLARLKRASDATDRIRVRATCGQASGWCTLWPCPSRTSPTCCARPRPPAGAPMSSPASTWLATSAS